MQTYSFFEAQSSEEDLASIGVPAVAHFCIIGCISCVHIKLISCKWSEIVKKNNLGVNIFCQIIWNGVCVLCNFKTVLLSMPLDLPREKEPSNLIESIEAGCVFLILNCFLHVDSLEAGYTVYIF